VNEPGAARPRHFKLDIDFRSNPKVMSLAANGGAGWQAIVMWLDSIAYSTRHLTDGYIPPHWPRTNGYTKPAINKLCVTELWHPAINLDFTEDNQEVPEPEGWLINDYAAYQVTRATWTDEGRRRHEASMKAHQARYGGGTNGQHPT